MCGVLFWVGVGGGGGRTIEKTEVSGNSSGGVVGEGKSP